MTAQEIYREALRRGLRLETRGDYLAVIPANACLPEFAELLRQHRGEILDLLKAACIAEISPDCVPWIHVAIQILAGEFTGADRSTTESLVIGLRGIPHPLCRQALQHLTQRNLKEIIT